MSEAATQALALPPELTIYTATDLAALFRLWLQTAAEPGTEPDFRVDGSAVHEVDGAGLQLLASLANSLAALGRTLTVDTPSPVLQRGARLTGLNQWLTQPATTEETA